MSEPGSAEWQQRVAELITEESAQPEVLWYVSFADDDNGGFKGAAVVMAQGILGAVARMNELGINPGGEVLAIQWDETIAGICPYPLDVLMDRATLKMFDPTVQSIREFEKETGKTVVIP